MKRITVTLPDELAALVDRERHRRDVSAAAIIREAIAAQIKPSVTPPAGAKRYSFIGIASSGGGEPTAANVEEYLAQHWADDIERDSGLKPRQPVDQQNELALAAADSSATLTSNAGNS